MRRAPPLRLLTVFASVARLGSMRAAAEELNVSQPAISQALRSLEGHVGARLLDRSAKPPVLTSAGRRLEAATREGLDLIFEAVEAIRAEAAAEANALTVACTLGMATYWLMPRLSDFYAAHPDALVNVLADPSELRRAPPNADVTLYYGADHPSGGRSHRLFDEVLTPVGRPDVIARLAAHGGLDRARLIHVEVETDGRWAGWAQYARAVGRPPPPSSGLRFNTYVHAAQAALDGRGVMLGWRSITAGLVAEGKLAELPNASVSLGTSYFLTLSAQAETRPAVDAFVDWIRTQAAAVDGQSTSDAALKGDASSEARVPGGPLV